MRLSARVGAANNYRLLPADCLTNEPMPCACAVEGAEVIVIGRVLDSACRPEQAPCGQLFQRRPGNRAASDGETGQSFRHAWIEHGLKSATPDKIGGEQRASAPDILLALSGRHNRDVLDLVGVEPHVVSRELAC